MFNIYIFVMKIIIITMILIVSVLPSTAYSNQIKPLLRFSLLFRRHSRFPSSIYGNMERIQMESSSTALYYQSFDGNNDGEGGKLSLKTVAILGVGLVGIFGLGLFGSFQEAIRTSFVDSKTTPKLASSKVAGDESSRRGSKTRMMTREINAKLSQIPIFYVDNGQGGIYVDNNLKGSLFVEYEDAQDFVSKSKLSNKISVTTLDKVYFTLIDRKQKLGSFLDDVVSKSNGEADYVFVPSSNQLSKTSESWKQAHSSTGTGTGNDIPLFRVEKLAFSKDEGYVFPLFLCREDAISTEQRRSGSNIEPTVQETSLKDVVNLFKTGGFEARSLEFYPSSPSIAKAFEISS